MVVSLQGISVLVMSGVYWVSVYSIMIIVFLGFFVLVRLEV